MGTNRSLEILESRGDKGLADAELPLGRFTHYLEK